MKKNYTLKKLATLPVLSFCLSFFCFNLHGQVLNFTADTAVDNGTNITETITIGPDNFVLNISHPGNEELDNLGGGDLVIFIGSGGAVLDESYTISLTRNGDPFSFTLNSLDYDTFGAGDISIENQDDAVITPNTNYPIGAGTITPANTTNATDISSFKITPNDTGGSLNDFGFHNFNITVGSTLSAVDFKLSTLKILPNPSNGNITIKNSGVALLNTTISDINGRTIATYDLNRTTQDKDLDLSSVLSSGVYLMRITSETASTVKKIVIQ